MFSIKRILATGLLAFGAAALVPTTAKADRYDGGRTDIRVDFGYRSGGGGRHYDRGHDRHHDHHDHYRRAPVHRRHHDRHVRAYRGHGGRVHHYYHD